MLWTALASPDFNQYLIFTCIKNSPFCSYSWILSLHKEHWSHLELGERVRDNNHRTVGNRRTPSSRDPYFIVSALIPHSMILSELNAECTGYIKGRRAIRMFSMRAAGILPIISVNLINIQRNCMVTLRSLLTQFSISLQCNHVLLIKERGLMLEYGILKWYEIYIRELKSVGFDTPTLFYCTFYWHTFNSLTTLLLLHT